MKKSLFFILICLITGKTLFAADPLFISLEESLRLVLSDNPSLEIARLKKEEALVNTRQARSNFLPDLDASASSNLTRDNKGSPSNHGNLSTSLNAKLNIFSGFSDTANLRAAESFFNYQNAKTEESQKDLLKEAAINYLNLLSAQEKMSVAEAELKAQTQLSEEISAFVKAGKRSVTDHYQQEAELASARQALTDAELELELALQKLLEITGLSYKEKLFALKPEIKAPEEIEKLEDRPDIRAARARISTAEAKKWEAESGKYPKLDLVASLGTGWAERSDGDFTEQVWADKAEAQLGLRLSIPVFDAFKTKNSKALASLDLEAGRSELKEKILKAEKEKAEAKAHYKASLKAIETSKARLKAANSALEAMTERYRMGAATMTELSTSRSVLVSAQYQMVDAETKLLEKIVLLKHALGLSLL